LTIIIPANSAADTAYDVDNSCRFDGTSYLHKTPTSAGNRRTWTYSLWVKRDKLGTNQRLLSCDDGSSIIDFGFADTDKMYIGFYDSSWKDTITTQVFRDTSAWMHICFAVDTTQGTSTNRMKFYVNGTQVTTFDSSAYVTQNHDTAVNNSTKQFILLYKEGTDRIYSGYAAEVCMIDGLQLAPTSFGEFDSDSPTIWKPIDVSGLTFGTNGFYCDFEDSANLGNDANGGTDLTEVNLAATDQSSDTPTLNYPTFNPLIKGNVATTLSEGNLKGVFGSGWSWLPATFGVQNGKWYWEAKVSATNDANLFIGITTEDQDWDDATPYDEAGTILYFADGRKSVDGTDTESHFASYTTNDIIGVALDLDSGTRTITFYKNNSVTPASSSAVTITSNFTGKFIMPVFVGNSSSAAANWELNFGSPPYANTSDAADANGYGAFEFAPPSGYIALNSKNLAEEG